MAPPGIKLVQKVSSTRTFGRLAPHVIPALDRTVHRLTRGKVLLSAQMLPGVILSVRGAKSGIERRTPLACMPEEERGTWLLIGSNWAARPSRLDRESARASGRRDQLARGGRPGDGPASGGR